MPSSTTLQHAIENITIWRKGEQRAPHKPLLLLYVLSQYQRGHARMFDYARRYAMSCIACWNALAHSAASTGRTCRSGA